MEFISHRLPRNGMFIDTGDWHFGAENCLHSGVDKIVQRVLELNANGRPCYLILKGDLMETIAPSDKRFNIHDRDLNMKTSGDQRDAVIETLRPVSEYILALGVGNHEIKDQNTIEYGKDICKALGVPYGAYTFVIEWKDEKGKLMFKSFHSHGAGQLTSNAKDLQQRVANMKAAVKRRLVNTGVCDCVYMSYGHTHQLLVVPPDYDWENLLTTSSNGIHQHDIPPINQTAKNIPPDQRFYANTGSMLKLYSTPGSGVVPYGERAMYRPADLGWVEGTFEDGRLINVEAVKV